MSFGALRPVSPMIFGRRREMDDGAVRRCGSRGFPRRVLWPSRPPPPAWRPSRSVAGADPGSARPPSRGEAHRASPPPAPARAHPSSGAFAGGGRRAAARSPWRGPGYREAHRRSRAAVGPVGPPPASGPPPRGAAAAGWAPMARWRPAPRATPSRGACGGWSRPGLPGAWADARAW